MKLQHYALIFIALSIGAVFSLFVTVQRNHTASTETNNATFMITASLVDAMNDAARNTDDVNYLFNSSEKRANAYNNFFDTLSLNLQQNVTKDKYIRDYIPCLFLVDTDGYYVAYQKKNSNGEYAMDITPIQTWTRELYNGSIIIRFYLTDYVEITNRVPNANENFVYEGTVNDVYNQLSSRLKGHLNSYLSDYQTYSDVRAEYIATVMSRETNFYINTYNTHAKHKYDVEIPHTKFLNYGRQIDSPCMFALIQGKYFGIAGTDANIFAFANSEVISSSNFYMYKKAPDEAYYHKNLNCIDATGTYHGIGTMKESAKKGFTPCPKCFY